MRWQTQNQLCIQICWKNIHVNLIIVFHNFTGNASFLNLHYNRRLCCYVLQVCCRSVANDTFPWDVVICRHCARSFTREHVLTDVGALEHGLAAYCRYRLSHRFSIVYLKAILKWKVGSNNRYTKWQNHCQLTRFHFDY